MKGDIVTVLTQSEQPWGVVCLQRHHMSRTLEREHFLNMQRWGRLSCEMLPCKLRSCGGVWAGVQMQPDKFMKRWHCCWMFSGDFHCAALCNLIANGMTSMAFWYRIFIRLHSRPTNDLKRTLTLCVQLSGSDTEATVNIHALSEITVFFCCCFFFNEFCSAAAENKTWPNYSKQFVITCAANTHNT